MREQFIQSRLKDTKIADGGDSPVHHVDEKYMLDEDMEHRTRQMNEHLPPGCVSLDVQALRHNQIPNSSASHVDNWLVQDSKHSELERLYVKLAACQYVSKLNLAAILGAEDAHAMAPRQDSIVSVFSMEYSSSTLDGSGLQILPQSKAQTEALELQVLVCRFVGNIGIKAMQLACITSVSEMQQKHWKHTRALVECMTAASGKAQQPHARHRSTRRKQSLSRPSGNEEMHCTDSQVSASGSSSGRHGLTNHQSHQEIENGSVDASHQQGSANTVHGQQGTQSLISSTSSASSASSASSRSERNQDGFIPSLHPDLAQFAGKWSCLNADDRVATWLFSLEISGNIVVDGTGDVLLLKQGMDGDVLLEGGRLVRQGQHMHRIGRKGGVLVYIQGSHGGLLPA